MVDPTGHFFITALIVGAAIGCAVGLGLVGYSDYKDDGKIFNGSKTVGDYAKGAVVGTVIGAAAGATVGYVGAMATGTAVTAGLSSGGAAAFNAGYAGLTAMGSNLAHQTAEKGIENVDCTEASVAGGFAAAGSLAISGVSKVIKRVGQGISKVFSKVGNGSTSTSGSKINIYDYSMSQTVENHANDVRIKRC